MATNLMSITETAKTLGVSPDTIRRLVKRQQLRSVRIARRVLIPMPEIDKVSEKGIRDVRPATN